jgi:hypothetical protein
MLIESIFSKEMGGPEKGRWVFLALKRAVWSFLLGSLIPAKRASPLAGTAGLHRVQTLATGRSSPALPTHHSGMGDFLRAHGASEPYVVGQDCPGWNQHPVHWWRCAGQWSLTRSSGRTLSSGRTTPPLACNSGFSCSSLRPHGSWGI